MVDKTFPTLTCRKCGNVSNDSWEWQYCKKCGNFITSSFSDVLIRNKKFELEKTGKKGLVQLISLLPTSYPGHNILTEDIGEIVGQDKCDLKGKHFKLYGRAKEAEIRGCSDAR